MSFVIIIIIILRELTTTKTRVAFWDPPSGYKNDENDMWIEVRVKEADDDADDESAPPALDYIRVGVRAYGSVSVCL